MRSAASLELFFLLLVSTPLAAGCDDPTHPERRSAHTIEVVSGDGQSATAAEALGQPLVVRVLDWIGRPVPGRRVVFTVAGGGSVDPHATVTDADGLVHVTWTLGTSTADSQEVEVRFLDNGGAQGRPSAVFRARALPGPPQRITALGDSGYAGSVGMPLADSLAVRVTDGYGNPVPGAPVVWRVLSGGGEVTPETGNTGSDGVARTLWTLGPRMDSAQVAEGLAGLTLRAGFVATAGVGLGARLVKVSGDAQTGEVGTPLAEPLRVRLLLADQRPIVGAPVSWSAGEAGTFSPEVSTTDENGEASAVWTMGKPFGPVAAQAAIAGTASVPFWATAVQLPRSIYWLEPNLHGGYHPPLLVGAANSLLDNPLGFIAHDRFNRPIAGMEVKWRVTAGSVAPVTSVTDSAGMATTRWTLGAPGDCNAYAKLPGNASEIQFWGFALTALYAGHDDGQLADAGSTIDVSVATVGTSAGAGIVDGASVRWTVLSGGGSVAPPVSRTVVQAINFNYDTARAATRWTLGPAGPQTLRATLGNLQVTLRADAMAHGTRVLLTQVPGRILDATPARVLWVDSAGVRTVRLRHLPAGTDETLATGLAAAPALGHLYSAGALFAVPAGGPAGELFEWRNGTLASLGQVDLWAGVRLSGEWVAWGTAAGRYRRDLAAGATITLPGAGAVLAVGPNGDVIWNEDSGRRRMQRYRDGQVTSFAFSNMNEDVVTDGVHVAAAERIMGNEWFRLVSGDGGTATQELLSYNPWVGFARTYGRGYDVSGGWVAWASHRQNVSWSRQGTYYVYRRPEPLTGHRRGMVETLAPNGELMYRTPEGDAWDAPIVRFLDVPGGLVWDFGPVGDGERVVWRDGAFLLITSDGTLYELHR